MREPPVVPRVACVAIAALLGIATAARPARAVEPGEWGSVKAWFFPGDSVILTLKDSTRVAGTFQGLSKIPPDDYRPRYEQWRASSPDASRMPVLGTYVELEGFGMSNYTTGSFRGFSQGAVEIQGRHGPTGPVAFDRFVRLAARGGVHVERRQLELWSEARALPLVTKLEVQTAEGPRTIALDDVAGTQAPGFAETENGLGRFADRIVPVSASAVEVGVSRYYGVNGADASLRFFPMNPGALGADIAIGYVKLDPGWLMTFDLAPAVSIPLGKHAGFETRLGGGLLFGSGSAAISANIGGALFALVAPNAGLRVDFGSRFGLWGLEGLTGVPFSVHVGVFAPHP